MHLLTKYKSYEPRGVIPLFFLFSEVALVREVLNFEVPWRSIVDRSCYTMLYIYTMSDLDWSTNDRSCLRPISSYAVNDSKGLIAWSTSWGWSSAWQLPEKMISSDIFFCPQFLCWGEGWHVAWTNYRTRLIRPTFGEAMAEHGLVALFGFVSFWT